MDFPAEKVALFVPCLVDQLYPEIGVALGNVLTALHFEVHYDPRHTCCGQPAFNAGFAEQAREVAASFISSFPDGMDIVTVSGSCTTMVRRFYPDLFKGTKEHEAAAAFSSRVFEFSEFIVRKSRHTCMDAEFAGRIGFHNSCHTLRELGIHREPLEILNSIKGLEIATPVDRQVCCGFGGVFYLKYSAVSSSMGESRLEYFKNAGVNTVVANDPGCIMQLRQEAQSRGFELEIIHLVEFLSRVMGLSPSLCCGMTA